ncbi:octanoyl-[acyl-carrier-protein]:protein N-octanoyltransferase LIPT2, mitochondrial isoform X2 [Perca flavescens]|uniref:octanoyl-[acyl-carrier-protein]:protein N-octanoyltransferase LIPT2, mitochondrial isoform X2 n=1 Tax=Perca flavescens TaxID=8167 RepID=UPI00106F077A|nr:putative lipoyltransferase 2, mitochondrial isoform X2 [Perca flavescens]
MRGVRPVVEVVRLGLVSYPEAVRLQQVYVERHRSGPAHALLLCQHPPVYTTGLRQEPYPPALLDRLRLLGAAVHRTNRGGLITFHGPGQLVCYPILHLAGFKKSVRWYVCELEKTIISVCSRFDVEASTSPHTGVWVGDNKICAIAETEREPVSDGNSYPVQPSSFPSVQSVYVRIPQTHRDTHTHTHTDTQTH